MGRVARSSGGQWRQGIRVRTAESVQGMGEQGINVSGDEVSELSRREIRSSPRCRVVKWCCGQDVHMSRCQDIRLSKS